MDSEYIDTVDLLQSAEMLHKKYPHSFTMRVSVDALRKRVERYERPL